MILDYAIKNRWLNRHSIRKLSIVLFLACAGIIATAWVRANSNSIKVQIAQYKCLHWIGQNQRVLTVYCADPTVDPTQFGVDLKSLSTKKITVASVPDPDCWKKYQAAANYHSYDNTTLFLGKVVSRTGIVRLVHVGQWTNFPNNHPFSMWGQLSSPVGFGGTPVITYASFGHPGHVSTQPIQAFGKVLKFYSGQVDPKDSSRFFVKFDIDGRFGTVDFQISDDGKDFTAYVNNGPGHNQ